MIYRFSPSGQAARLPSVETVSVQPWNVYNDLLVIVDFDEDGQADNINFIIKRIKVWTSASAPGYRLAIPQYSNGRLLL